MEPVVSILGRALASTLYLSRDSTVMYCGNKLVTTL